MGRTLRAKLVVVGESTVGKSALVQMFRTDGQQYPKNYNMTVAAELGVKTVNVPDSNASVELFIYDVSGKDLYNELHSKFLPNTDLVAVVYDSSSAESFAACYRWLEAVRKFNPGKPLTGVLIGNKSDLDTRQAVSSHQGHEFAQNHGLEFFDTSALRGTGVENPFTHLAKVFIQQYEDKVRMYQILKG